MPNTVLKQIEEAEAAAESIRLDAVREARDMLKSVEEAGISQARQAAKALSEETQKRMDAARVLIRDEIKSLEVRRGAEREAMRNLAMARVKDAGLAVFERIVSDGNR